MRKVSALTVLLVALSFSAQAEEPKAAPAPEAKKVVVAVPKGTVKVVGVKVLKAEPKKVEPAKAEPAPASQPAKAEPAPVAPKADPAPAPAPAPTVQNWWQEGLTELIKLICAILLILATTFVAVLKKKYGFDYDTTVLDNILHRAVSYVEQTTTSKLGAGAEKTPGAKKMEMAVEIAKKLAADTKLKEKGTEWWMTHLESWLGATSASKSNGATPAPSPEKPA